MPSPAAAVPPGPTLPRPLQTLAWFTRPVPWLERQRARYGDAFTLRIASEGEWVMLSDPAAIRQVFTGDPRLLHAGKANAVLGPVLGSSSVLLLDDDPHLVQRKLLLPPFHGERMRRYEALMTSVAEREVATWPVGDAVELLPRMQALTMEIILHAVFGMDEGARMDRMRGLLTDFMHFVSRPRNFLAMAAFGPKRMERSGLFRRATADVDALLAEEVERRRADPGLAERDDILSLLVQARHEDGSPMRQSELRDELLTLLLAGHETTATSLAWALERLLRNPAAWERLREEARGPGEVAYADATVKETLRLRPVVPVVVRMLQEDMEIGGMHLPKGARVAPCIVLVHRREDVYPEPLAFRPERFLETPAGTYTWIPFGGGIRRCLGASFALFEMRTVLQVIARTATLRADRPEPEPVRRRAIMLTPRHGGRVVREPAPAPRAPATGEPSAAAALA